MIDSHCHLNFKSLSNNLNKIIDNCKKNNVTNILSINTNPKDFINHLNLIKKYSGIYISYGLHPCEVDTYKQLSILDFEKQCDKPEVIGIGETGIDLYHSKNNLKEQIISFELHIKAAIKYNLPIIIHQRNSENEIVKILQKYLDYNLKVVFHCFTGSSDLINFCVKNKFYISLSGIVTFKNSDNLRNIIKDFPLEYMLIETDSPFLSPVPMRGKRNEPAYIKYIAEYLSHFYKISNEQFVNITDKNFFKLFNKTKKDNQL